MTEEIKIIEFGRIVIKGIPSSTIRVRMMVGDREFVRLFQYGYPHVWREENETGFCSNEEAEDLESIFKAWCLENGHNINEPQKLIEQ